MKSGLIQIVSYAVLIAGGLFLAGAIYFLAQTQYSMSQTLTMLTGSDDDSRERIQQASLEEEVHALDFDVRTQVDSQVFSDRHLRYGIMPAENHLIFNEILSNDGRKIAYAELSDCAGRTHSYGDRDALPSCQWDFSIKILYRDSGSTVTAFSATGDEKDLNDVALIYHPYAWTKLDKNLVVAWSNIGTKGRGDAPAEFSILDLSSNRLQPLNHPGEDITFSQGFGAAIYLGAGEKNICDQEIKASPGAIVITSLATGETKKLVSEKDTLYSIEPLNRDTDELTYSYRKARDAQDCSDPGPDDGKKTIKAVF